MRRRVEAHRLLEDHARPFELGKIGETRQARTQHAIDLLMKPCLRLRVPGQEIPGPAQRIRRRLVPGQEDRQDLVAELLVAHALAGLGIARGKQHGQEIATIDAVGSPLAKKPRHHRVEGGDGLAVDSWLQPRQPFGEPEEVEHAGPHRHDLSIRRRTVSTSPRISAENMVRAMMSSVSAIISGATSKASLLPRHRSSSDAVEAAITATNSAMRLW